MLCVVCTLCGKHAQSASPPIIPALPAPFPRPAGPSSRQPTDAGAPTRTYFETYSWDERADHDQDTAVMRVLPITHRFEYPFMIIPEGMRPAAGLRAPWLVGLAAAGCCSTAPVPPEEVLPSQPQPAMCCADDGFVNVHCAYKPCKRKLGKLGKQPFIAAPTTNRCGFSWGGVEQKAGLRGGEGTLLLACTGVSPSPLSRGPAYLQ